MSHHQHPPGHAHPSPEALVSLLRLSLAARLAMALAAAALMWAAVFWAGW